jgi:hypothetical protein
MIAAQSFYSLLADLVRCISLVLFVILGGFLSRAGANDAISRRSGHLGYVARFGGWIALTPSRTGSGKIRSDGYDSTSSYTTSCNLYPES